ncbi:hypothetical protein FGG66_gp26 [Corynebacterium phage phi674]|uniref:Uncharacterized protein n=1 Tax=Corynebacterium phage phi674 TaxID=2052822 RepID=A0A2H4PJ25_9CAUD|nr:hypothetical protein FGG66_gp26 [Corynebacterium phage phi674]ATW62944.1 hypothetical protein phi674_gp26 [Corynebacterium phage phi674]
MSTVQGNLRGVLANLRNAGVFDSIQGDNYGITTVTSGEWTIQYWVAVDDGVKWFATNAAGAKAITGEYTAGDYRTLLVEILNSVVGHFPENQTETKSDTSHEMETPAREPIQLVVAPQTPHTVRAGHLDKSHIGSTVTMPWVFRDHEATITGVLESVKHDEYRTYFEMEDTGNYSQGYAYRCDSESVVVIHPEPEANDEVEDESNE